MYEAIIERVLRNAKHCKEGEVGKIGASLPKGMMLYIEYHTSGKMNICDSAEEMTSEHFDWKMAGCKNREEWIRYLNKQFWDAL